MLCPVLSIFRTSSPRPKSPGQEFHPLGKEPMCLLTAKSLPFLLAAPSSGRSSSVPKPEELQADRLCPPKRHIGGKAAAHFILIRKAKRNQKRQQMVTLQRAKKVIRRQNQNRWQAAFGKANCQRFVTCLEKKSLDRTGERGEASEKWAQLEVGGSWEPISCKSPVMDVRRMTVMLSMESCRL